MSIQVICHWTVLEIQRSVWEEGRSRCQADGKNDKKQNVLCYIEVPDGGDPAVCVQRGCDRACVAGDGPGRGEQALVFFMLTTTTTTPTAKRGQGQPGEERERLT
jgi:hypothetical protein